MASFAPFIRRILLTRFITGLPTILLSFMLFHTWGWWLTTMFFAVWKLWVFAHSNQYNMERMVQTMMYFMTTAKMMFTMARASFSEPSPAQNNFVIPLVTEQKQQVTLPLATAASSTQVKANINSDTCERRRKPLQRPLDDAATLL